MWLSIKEIRSLPSAYYGSPQCASDTCGVIEPEHAAAVSDGESQGPAEEMIGRAASSPLAHSNGSVAQCFARVTVLSKLLETQPEAAIAISEDTCVRWNSGFLLFWGPSVVDQNDLKDFIEEHRMEIEVHHTAEASAFAAPLELPWNFDSPEVSKQMLVHGPLKQQKSVSHAARKRRATAKSQRCRATNAEDSSFSENIHSDGSNNITASADITPIRPPHGIATFCLSALGSCGATNLFFCTDVLPVSGYVVRRGEEGEPISISRVNGPDFMRSGTRLTVEISLAEPLFRPRPLAIPPSPQDTQARLYADMFSFRTCVVERRVFTLENIADTMSARSTASCLFRYFR